MQVQVTGIHLDIGDALRSHVTDRLSASVQKYFDRPVDAQVTFSKSGHEFRVDCAVHLSSGMRLNTQANTGDIYGCFDASLERLEKRLRRYKRRLKDHHNAHKSPLPALDVPYVTLATEMDKDDDTSEAPLEPVVISESTKAIPFLAVSDAAMQMDISDVPFVIFRNSDGGVNLVYRRDDGHIGWIDAGREAATL